MRIVLAYKSHAQGAHDPYTSLLPIGLGYINALLRGSGYQSTLANFSVTNWHDVETYLTKEMPSIVGISQFTHNRFESLKLAAVAKRVNPRCVVVLGGPHATHRYAEIMSCHREVDAIVVGEGEETFVEVARVVAAGGGGNLSSIPGLAVRQGERVSLGDRRPPIANLDDFPFPATGMSDSFGVDTLRQSEFIVTSRGCPASCRFCSSPGFWQQRMAFRSPRSIVDEIKFIQQQSGLLYFSFRDDTFTADRKRILAFCRLLVDEKVYILWNCQSRVTSIDEEVLAWMKRAGCECIQLGVESGSPRILKALGKQISPEQVHAAARAVRRVGINLSIYLITGVLEETDDDVAASARLIEKILPHDGQVSPLAYYPGTSLFSDAVSAGLVRPDLFESCRDAALPVRADRFTVRATDSLLSTLRRAAEKGRFRPKDFLEQKRLVGYTHAGNIMAGELFEEQGRPDRAASEYAEIIQRQPCNPWGWLAMGELQGEMGDLAGARHSFENVLRLVPAHAPALIALGDVAEAAGDRTAAMAFFRQALERNPADVVASGSLKRLRRK